MNDSFKNVMFDKMLRLTHPYSLLYRDLLLFILYFVIFRSQITLLIIWSLEVAYFLVYMYVFPGYHHYILKKKIFPICFNPKIGNLKYLSNLSSFSFYFNED